MRSNHSFPRPASMLLAALVGALTMTCTARATQTNTTPDASSTTYNLAAGANGANITPSADKPVYVAGVCTVSGNRGTGHVSMLHATGAKSLPIGTGCPPRLQSTVKSEASK